MHPRSLAPVFVCLFSAAAWPQEAKEAKENRDGLRVSGLPTVYVQTEADGEITGKLVGLNEEAVVILVGDDERRFEMENVRRVQKKGDSIKNGAILGAVVGVAMGILAARIADCVDDDGRVGSCGTGGTLGFVAASTAFYTGAGAGIDALVPGRTTLYEAREWGSTPRHRSGVRFGFTLSW